VSERLTGLGVSPGVVTGPVARMSPPLVIPSDLPPPTDREGEQGRATRALAAVAEDLRLRAERVGGEGAEVLQAMALMAEDSAVADLVHDRIGAGEAAVPSVASAFGEFRSMLAAAGPYLSERVADLDDIRNRVVANLLGLPMPGTPEREHPYVLVAEDLAPADTAALDPATVLAIVTERGGPTSHTAILSKALGIPAVVACAGAMSMADEDPVLVDGGRGVVLVRPEEDVVADAVAASLRDRDTQARTTGPGRTADGVGVELLANIGSPRDLAHAGTADVEGVGLFRTEFLFLDRSSAPSHEEQRTVYAQVFDAFAGRKVVIRTLDAGADKPMSFVPMAEEPNPALGVRGYRTARRSPELLDEQLAAIGAAARGSDAQVWVMAPMVSLPSEAHDFVGRAHRHGLAVAGVMVEVPAAALRASRLLLACDFASLGTNDLAQYTFAADRMAGDLADLLDPWQPALLDLLRTTAEAGAELGKPVGVCGEAASDPLLALVLVGLGVTSLSMAAVSVPAVRAALSQQTIEQCRTLARAALDADDGVTARAAVESLLVSPGPAARG
jgi:phosphotransferase system enzyme I (PtsI)